jgi:hypothetical protein
MQGKLDKGLNIQLISLVGDWHSKTISNETTRNKTKLLKLQHNKTTVVQSLQPHNAEISVTSISASSQ